MSNYEHAVQNLIELEMRGCFVMLEVDATKIASHSCYREKKFDRIVFNFPHAGFTNGGWDIGCVSG